MCKKIKKILKWNIKEVFNETFIYRSIGLLIKLKMASFVNFLKAALIPSVKAQEDVVNPQEVLKVILNFVTNSKQMKIIFRLCMIQWKFEFT